MNIYTWFSIARWTRALYIFIVITFYVTAFYVTTFYVAAFLFIQVQLRYQCREMSLPTQRHRLLIRGIITVLTLSFPCFAAPPACMLSCINAVARGIGLDHPNHIKEICQEKDAILGCLLDICPIGHYDTACDSFLGTCSNHRKAPHSRHPAHEGTMRWAVEKLVADVDYASDDQSTSESSLLTPPHSHQTQNKAKSKDSHIYKPHQVPSEFTHACLHTSHIEAPSDGHHKISGLKAFRIAVDE